MSQLKRFKLKDVEPNPFRDMKRYPIDQEKVKELRRSIQQTSFWDNILARMKNGHPEIAYGHHRLAALREELGRDAEIGLIVRDIDDDAMIRIMAAENLEYWGTNIWVQLETVRAIVHAYAQGKVRLDEKKIKATNIKDHPEQYRWAPSFVLGVSRSRDANTKPYIADMIADVMNVESSVTARLLQALGLIELGAIDERRLKNLNDAEFRALLAETQSTYERSLKQQKQEGDEPDPKIAATDAVQSSDAFLDSLAEDPEAGIKTAREAAKEADPTEVEGPPPDFEKWSTSLRDRIDNWLVADKDSFVEKLSLMAKNVDEIQPRVLNSAATGLRRLAERAEKWADKLTIRELSGSSRKRV